MVRGPEISLKSFDNGGLFVCRVEHLYNDMGILLRGSLVHDRLSGGVWATIPDAYEFYTAYRFDGCRQSDSPARELGVASQEVRNPEKRFDGGV